MISIALCDDEPAYLDFYEKRIKLLARKLKVMIEVIKFSSATHCFFILKIDPLILTSFS